MTFQQRAADIGNDPSLPDATALTEVGDAGSANQRGRFSIRGPIARWMLRRFRRRWGYDVGYMEEMLATAPEAFFRFVRIGDAANHRRAAPLPTWGAIRLVATRACDCGPCLQLGVDQLLAAGLDETSIVAVLEEDRQAMDTATRLGFELGVALVERARLDGASSSEAVTAADRRVEVTRRAVEQAHGREALIECALAFAVLQTYPTIKRAMGHAQSCSLVHVGQGRGQVAVA